MPLVIDAVIKASQSGVPCANAPMNSGWTKIAAVYSTISSGAPSQVIWDSRVSLSICTRLGAAARGAGITPATLRSSFDDRIGWVGGRGGNRPKLMASVQQWFPNRYGKWPAHFEGGLIVAEMSQILNSSLQTYGSPKQALLIDEIKALQNLGIEPPKKWTPWLVACVLFMDGQ